MLGLNNPPWWSMSICNVPNLLFALIPSQSNNWSLCGGACPHGSRTFLSFFHGFRNQRPMETMHGAPQRLWDGWGVIKDTIQADGVKLVSVAVSN